MANDDEEIVLNGRSLHAIVRAAETPLVGAGVKSQLFRQLGLDELFEVDMRDYMDPDPLTTPDIPDVPSEVQDNG